MSGLPIRARYKHFKTICDNTFDNSPTDSSSSFLNGMDSHGGLEVTISRLSQKKKNYPTTSWNRPLSARTWASIAPAGWTSSGLRGASSGGWTEGPMAPVEDHWCSYCRLALLLQTLGRMGARTWNFVQLLFATSFNAFLSMSFHVARQATVFAGCFSHPGNCLSCSSRNSWFQHLGCVPRQCSRSICIHVECISSTRGQEMLSVLPDQPASSLPTTQDSDSVFFHPLLCPSTYTHKNWPCFSMNEYAFANAQSCVCVCCFQTRLEPNRKAWCQCKLSKSTSGNNGQGWQISLSRLPVIPCVVPWKTLQPLVCHCRGDGVSVHGSRKQLPHSSRWYAVQCNLPPFHRVFLRPAGAVEDTSGIPLFTHSLGPTVFTGRAALNTVQLPQSPQILHILVLCQRIGDVGRASHLGHVQKTLLHTFLEPQQPHVQMPHLSEKSSGHEGLSHWRIRGHVRNPTPSSWSASLIREKLLPPSQSLRLAACRCYRWLSRRPRSNHMPPHLHHSSRRWSSCPLAPCPIAVDVNHDLLALFLHFVIEFHWTHTLQEAYKPFHLPKSVTFGMAMLLHTSSCCLPRDHVSHHLNQRGSRCRSGPGSPCHPPWPHHRLSRATGLVCIHPFCTHWSFPCHLSGLRLLYLLEDFPRRPKRTHCPRSRISPIFGVPVHHISDLHLLVHGRWLWSRSPFLDNHPATLVCSSPLPLVASSAPCVFRYSSRYSRTTSRASPSPFQPWPGSRCPRVSFSSLHI